jgi:enoyl-CoA hydratase
VAQPAGGGESGLRIERLDAVLRITIDNPRSKLNAVDAALHDELVVCFRALGDETEARAVLLTGAGPAFSAGGDLDWIVSIDTAERVALHRQGRQLINAFLDIELPVVVAVNGPAVGVGASIALLGDVIMMADEATLADPHVQVGLAAGDGGILSWPHAVGPARAKRYLMTGDPVSAADAYAFGLATHVLPAAELAGAALAFAQRLAALPPLAVRYTKLGVNAMLRQSYENLFGYSLSLEQLTLGTADVREAVAAFRERRPGKYVGH